MKTILSLALLVTLAIVSASEKVNAQNAASSPEMTPELKSKFEQMEQKLEKYAETMEVQRQRIEQLEKVLGVNASAKGPLADLSQTKNTNVIVVDEDIYREKIKSVVDEYLQEKEAEEDKAELLGGWKKKFFLRSIDDDFDIRFGGRVQFQLRALRGVNEPIGGEPIDSDLFVPRARMFVSGRLHDYYEYKVQADFAPRDALLKDGFLNLHFWDALQFKFGQFKIPFGRERLRSTKYIDFVERSLAVDNLAPDRDYGAMIHGRLFDGVLQYAVGIFDGTAPNTRDDNDEKELGARIVLTPFKKSSSDWINGLELGTSYTFGEQDNGSKSVRGRTAGDVDFFDRVSVDGERNRIGGDVAWYVGPTSIIGEYIHVDEERKNLGPYIGGNQSNLDTLESDGWYVQATYLLTGEKKGPKTVKPKHDFDPKDGGWGALELAFRYGTIEHGANDLIGNRAQALTYGLNWYMNNHVRFALDWINNDITHKLEGDGHWDTVLARIQIVW